MMLRQPKDRTPEQRRVLPYPGNGGLPWPRWLPWALIALAMVPGVAFVVVAWP